MKVKNSLQVESSPPGHVPRILVSYYRATMEREEYTLVSRLLADLQAIGLNVIADEIHNMHAPLQLHIYDWIVLIQTKDVASSTCVKERLAKALYQNEGHHQGILHVFVSAAGVQKTMLAAETSTTFDASIDYPRAFAGIVLTIHPDYRARLYGVERGGASAAIASSNSFSGIFTDFSLRPGRMAGQRHPLYILLIALTVLILLGAIITHSFAYSSVKTPAIKTITSNQHISNQHINTPTTTTTVMMAPEIALYKQVTSRAPVINDSLQSQSASQWEIMQQKGSSCAFSNGSYHVSILPPSQGHIRYTCLAQGAGVFTNFAIQVDMQLLRGDVGGMIFRANGRSSYSWFSLDLRGCYRLVHFTASGQTLIRSDDRQSCIAVNMQNANQLTVIAQGSNIYLYINGKFMSKISDPSSIKGEIGLLAIERTQPTDVAFSNLKVWQ
jgi:hypothetical protein